VWITREKEKRDSHPRELAGLPKATMVLVLQVLSCVFDGDQAPARRAYDARRQDWRQPALLGAIDSMTVSFEIQIIDEGAFGVERSTFPRSTTSRKLALAEPGSAQIPRRVR
jgi:hypothetical protein